MLYSKEADGVKAAVLVAASYVTEPETTLPERVKFDVFIDEASIVSLKVAETIVLTDTPVAPLVGETVRMVGGVVSGNVVVVVVVDVVVVVVVSGIP